MDQIVSFQGRGSSLFLRNQKLVVCTLTDTTVGWSLLQTVKKGLEELDEIREPLWESVSVMQSTWIMGHDVSLTPS